MYLNNNPHSTNVVNIMLTNFTTWIGLGGAKCPFNWIQYWITFWWIKNNYDTQTKLANTGQIIWSSSEVMDWGHIRIIWKSIGQPVVSWCYCFGNTQNLSMDKPLDLLTSILTFEHWNGKFKLENCNSKLKFIIEIDNWKVKLEIENWNWKL